MTDEKANQGELAEEQTGAVRRSLHTVCPGLDLAEIWDQPGALRGELYTAERLAEHAIDLARAHGQPSLRATAGPLRQRFGAAKARIREAYEILARDERSRRDPSPAEEWLLDNSHVVDDQIREIHEDLPWGYLVQLPRLSSGAMRGYPRVYGLCLDYLRHTDAHLDLSTLSGFVRAYQTVSDLTIGELWAVPIMLRLGLILTVGALASSEANARDRARADAFADELLETAASPEGVRPAIQRLERDEKSPSDAFLVQLLRRLRAHDAPSVEVTDWIRRQCERKGTTPEDLARKEHLRQAADQVSVGNSITSMRQIAALDWSKFFEQVSTVEAVLGEDPSGAHRASDDATRDRCRHAVEKLARRSAKTEAEVARLALDLARAAEARSATVAETHVGYYLVDRGRKELERRIRYRFSAGEWITRPLLAAPSFFYLSTVFVVTALLAVAAWRVSHHTGVAPGVAWLVFLLALVPASEIAVSLANALVIALLPPRLLPKLQLEEGIRPEHTTLVVVPSLLDSATTVATLLEDLEVRSLANPEKNLYFALVTDFTDSPTRERDGDAQLLQLAEEGIRELNARHSSSDEHRFWLLHRERRQNPTEGKFMGWERKRGKLEELNRLLRGSSDTSFAVVSGPRELLRKIRYVITLDADTELPRDVARKLVGTLAHPLNQAVIDPKRRRVVSGHGILQPRVGTLPLSSRRSRFARIFAGPPGIDPYTSAVSDVYQDLLGEGSFVGKGIYDVDAFLQVMAGRVPENTLLSHDLFEGNLLRSALVTDIEVLDEQPDSYAVVASRQHRWMRGDWQLLPWLLPRVPTASGRAPNPFRAMDLWKFIDNLRRSLLPPTLMALALVSWLSGGATALLGSAAIALVFSSPVLCRALLDAVRGGNRSQSRLSALGGDLKANSQQLVLNVAFLVDQALLSLDAIGRTLYRLLISRRSLLEWTTMSQASQRFRRVGSVEPRMWLAFGLAIVTLAALLIAAPASVPLALPAVLLWGGAPFLALWLRMPEPVRDKLAELTAADRRLLRAVARKTWRFFEVFVGDEDNHLPPDNYQEDPRGVVAHRTSPTNIGLYLLSVVAARDFGFVTLRELVTRLEKTLGTIERLEKRNGHILNWYETTTLRPLEPQYVSTVDSGNLAGYLWTLREAVSDLAAAPFITPNVFEAARDALHLASQQLSRSKTKDAELSRRIASADRRLEEAGERIGTEPFADYALLLELGSALTLLASDDSRDIDVEARYWLEQASAALLRCAEEVSSLAPFVSRVKAAPSSLAGGELGIEWTELVSNLGRALSLNGLANLGADAHGRVVALRHHVEASNATDESQAVSFLVELEALLDSSRERGSQLKEALNLVGARAGALGDGMDFRFLFDEDRSLFSIGYNVGSMRLDGSHYDLLASEARLASLLSVAKGDAPQRHWFRAGRPRTVVDSRGVLLSWSGSMFEYLMPLLVTHSYSDTLLDETYSTCVLAQRKYGSEKGVPWGISEAAYNVMDLSMTYQYRAFGVPGLGLKAGLGEDLVIAPYATALAAMVEPKLATQNMRALAKEGLDGPYGFYESIDYTPAHLPPGRRGVVVKAYMAHHQGMALVALDNVLFGMPMARRFHNEPRIKASALLLEERLPTTAPVVEVRATQIAAPAPSEPEVYTAEHVGLGGNEGPRVHLLGHGELSTLLTATGGGFTTWKNLDVTRFREDAALDPGGIYIYVRDHSRSTMWSAAHLPTQRTPDFYDAAFHIDRVAFHRRDGAIETLTEIVVSPEHPAEVRRITLTNHGEAEADVDITTYSEIVIGQRAADLAHPAFSSMFIETEAMPARGALLARRRPRSASEAPVWVVQVLSPGNEGFSELTFDTSRPNFVGRGGTLAEPLGMRFGHELSGTLGCVLDPAFALRRRVRLAPGARASLTLTTALASSRETALELVEIHATPHHAERTFGLAFADARVELKHLGITATQSHRFQRLLSAVLFPLPSLRAAPEPAALRGKGRSALWAQGISGDLPIVVLRIDEADFHELCRELLLAHEFFRLNGVSVDLVLLNEEPSGYLLPMQDAVLDLVRGSPAQAHLDQRGGVFVRRTALLNEDDRTLLTCAARVVLRASQGTLAQQLRKAALGARSHAARLKAFGPPRTRAEKRRPRPQLLFDNGIGGFSADGREYVMLLDRERRTPAPWCNVMANPSFGSLVSESGSGCTWFGNSQRHRLTPWSNDATRDPSGEVLYLRDEGDGTSWSLTPAPAGRDVEFTVRHGAGYTHFEHVRGDLEQLLTVFVSATDPVKFFRVKLTNRGGRARKMSLFGVVEWVLGGVRDSAHLTTATCWDTERRAALAFNPWSVFPERRALFFATHPVASFTCDRKEWFGRFGSRERPTALERVGLSGHTGVGFDPCAALQVPIELAAGQEIEIAFALADAESNDHARALAERYGDMKAVNAAFDELNQHWEKTLGAVQVKTPDPAFDLMTNRWLLYQALSCRIWARTAFYQSSGAYGYRDQVQDVLALLLSKPELAREHLLRAAARQFAEGDVQHWWHPETGEGIRSRCSDDLLWLPYATAQYVLATADKGILEERVPVLEERQLAANENDLFGSPPASKDGVPLYEHCVRALMRGASEGPHGLPLMRGGDWNDGMNRVGREGKGESVWLSWFLAKTLKDFALVAKQQGDAVRVAWCTQQVARLAQAIDAHAWDGAWYRRAIFDDGTPLGSAQNSECQIDAIAQSWAVISGVGDERRAAQALRSAEQRLVVEDERMMLLLTPPFERAEPDPGYIRSYPPGIRENGGQYTHGVLWTVVALCLQGEGDRAYRLMSHLNPVHHGENLEQLARYRVEPYVVAADVYSSPEHHGRGGWTWYTGSASWMYRDMVESILGLSKENGRLRIAPCLPREWPGFEATYRYGNSELEIVVENPERISSGTVQLSVDDRPEPTGAVALIDDGRRRRVRAVLRTPLEEARRRVSGS